MTVDPFAALAEILERPLYPLTLERFTPEQRALIAILLDGDNTGMGTSGKSLTLAERETALELFQDGIADYVIDPDGSEWLHLTARGGRLANGEAIG
ncbi:hypothetical protein [Aureimonas leprariae]|uniref:Uncharacterized protein n=1 Tax=Plantimonas leprariae TaxID=2615207 RepID=A0A7V7PPX8_9HYPH|nr:hypothetical protein [Aureimonas leprariae]KAB0680168.1 hypothetical protein F6X38_08235 [Aureimonas leprariae]